jgi:catechol 2,3-dioxygenase-like lactoylglutathione lyase family enzyme
MNATITMISLVVKNQAEALEFYTKKLDFEIKIDYQNPPPGDRWVAVGPKGQDIGLALVEPESFANVDWGKKGVGGWAPPIVIEAEDLQKTYDELKSRGVQFKMELKQEAYGKAAIFTDPYGNLFEIVQSPMLPRREHENPTKQSKA